MQENEKLSIVIPAYNEEEAIAHVIEGIKALHADFICEIIVVDDGSLDTTAQRAAEAGAIVLFNHTNLGYGAALKVGIRAAKGQYILTMDSDGQHHPSDIPILWERAMEADMIIGQRSGVIHSTPWRMPGKWLLALMANYIAERNIPDLNSGFRIFAADIVRRYIHLCPNGFSFSTTITLAMIKRGYRVLYVPIATAARRSGKSRVSLQTGFDTILLILRLAVLFDPLRVFIPISLIIGLVGVAWGVPYALMGRGVSVGSMLAIITALLMFVLGLLSDQISQLRLERYE
ncbi:MAG: glycosyltransferase family 2 protein [Anaerolineae bacterium]|nr:glycosyltransferase family 2 protein [Anaerolineae bacterium]